VAASLPTMVDYSIVASIISHRYHLLLLLLLVSTSKQLQLVLLSKLANLK
jgi:hypothetical protein